jgi:sugar phosphate isomerase/epimerase
MVNFARYAKALEAIGYDGYVCVEWEGWFKGGPGGVGDMDSAGLADMDRASLEAYEFLAPHFEKK